MHNLQHYKLLGKEIDMNSLIKLQVWASCRLKISVLSVALIVLSIHMWDNLSSNANLYFDLQIRFILSQMQCWSCQCQGLLDFLFPSFTAKHFWAQKYSEIQHLIVSSCAHINLATIRLSMLCVTKCVLHFDACVQIEDGKVVRHEDL